MKAIILTKGQSAIVDDADFEELARFKWYAQETLTKTGFYAARIDKLSGRRVLILMHRVINRTPVELLTDHIDGNGLHNWRTNLRQATPLQNTMNKAAQTGGTSAFKGVWRDGSTRNRKEWRAAIRLNGKLKYLGRFHEELDAAKAYQAAAQIHFGQFNRSTEQ